MLLTFSVAGSLLSVLYCLSSASDEGGLFSPHSCGTLSSLFNGMPGGPCNITSVRSSWKLWGDRGGWEGGEGEREGEREEERKGEEREEEREGEKQCGGRRASKCAGGKVLWRVGCNDTDEDAINALIML
jgi:hypothetical protein